MRSSIRWLPSTMTERIVSLKFAVCAVAPLINPGAVARATLAATLMSDAANADRMYLLSIYREVGLSAAGSVEQACFQYVAPRDEDKHSQQQDHSRHERTFLNSRRHWFADYGFIAIENDVATIEYRKWK